MSNSLQDTEKKVKYTFLQNARLILNDALQIKITVLETPNV